jgi:hypothetical protein
MTNLTKFLSATALCAAVVLPVTLTATAADARVSVGIGINLTPPPARVEERGRNPWSNGVWIDGHWARHGDRQQWVWVPGRWERPAHGGARWIPGHYNGNGNWVEGRWI